MTIVIADASPLIGLARVGGLVWLPKLFGDLVVTPIILQEVLPGLGMKDEAAIQDALDAGWLKPWKRKIKPPPISLGDLDEGESECIALALQLQPAASLLLIDERAGRATAKELGITITGTAAIIGLAKKQRLIKAAKPYFAKLHGSDFRISAVVIQKVLQGVGEA
jgi:predicted nucleic acid-binding protein